MNESNTKDIKCSTFGKTAPKITVLLFVLGLTNIVGLNFLLSSSTSKMPAFANAYINMRSKVVNTLVHLTSSESVNGTTSLNSSAKYANVSERNRKSFVTNSSAGGKDNVRKKDVDDKFTRNDNVNIIRRQNYCSSCFQHNFNYVIQNENICKQYSADQSIDLIILIMTKHGNIKERTALRSTWLSHSKTNTANIRYAFLLGEINDNKLKEAVLHESNVYYDIIKEDFVDTYMNLTFKTIMGFKWVATKCAHAHYVMKTDDDMFVNIPNVLKIFKGPHNETLQKAVGGACHAKARPIRNRKSKWFASENSYPEQSYPGFCSGTGYVTSMHVANEVYKISPHIPFFHLEDVYVSLCVKKLGLKLQPISGFNAFRPTIDPCLYKGGQLITAHQLTPVMLQSVWQRQCNRKH